MIHVWEKQEILLESTNEYGNPYAEVQVWVDLKGPGFEKRCYGFWDGGKTFVVRILATQPGEWSWESGANVRDSGLIGKAGSFTAHAWSEDERSENICRRGMIRATDNHHAFDHADGTPYFLVGDTWYAASTFRFPWHEDDTPRPLGPEAGFKDYVRLRQEQGFNCVSIIAAFPNWANDGHPPRCSTSDDLFLRCAWPQAGTESAKDMTDEQGDRPFLFPGLVPGFEDVVPDLDRINPAYYRSLDRKIDYLNAQGILPMIEVARRDIGQPWKTYHAWPDSYTRYIQYVWSRYQANICFFSPIHYDSPVHSIPAEDWNQAACAVLDRFGPPPFGTLASTNACPTTLQNWDDKETAPWLGFHQVGNQRSHNLCELLEEIYFADSPMPGINGEPYYDGMIGPGPVSDVYLAELIPGRDRNEETARWTRSLMYGSILSGGLGGHLYGSGGWGGGVWSGECEDASKDPLWKDIQRSSGPQMGHLKTFVLSEGARYQDLIPQTSRLDPHKSSDSQPHSGWAFCAGTEEQDFFLLYFELGAQVAALHDLPRGALYQGLWFDPRTGEWLDNQNPLRLESQGGKLALSAFPDGESVALQDWALKLIQK